MIVIFLNGYPGSGKDTFINAVSEMYSVYHHSTIDVCKKVCANLKWNGVKDDKSRKMLVELKKWYIEYFDGVFRDVIVDFNWVNDDCDIFFIVSRESDEIKRIRKWFDDNNIDTYYIFLDRDTKRDFGNESDNNALDGYTPDIHFVNDKGFDDLETRALELMNDLITKNLSEMYK